jgi:acyl dehydratase
MENLSKKVDVMNWSFSAPIKFNDTIHAVLTVHSMRPTKQIERGILVFAAQVINQHGTVVQQGEMTMMMKRAPQSIA